MEYDEYATSKRLKCYKYISNEFRDRYRVEVIVQKKSGNGWTCKTLEDARESVKLFFTESDNYRSKAYIFEDGGLVETIHNPESRVEFKVRKKKSVERSV